MNFCNAHKSHGLIVPRLENQSRLLFVLENGKRENQGGDAAQSMATFDETP
jgi:hypothetical protein